VVRAHNGADDFQQILRRAGARRVGRRAVGDHLVGRFLAAVPPCPHPPAGRTEIPAARTHAPDALASDVHGSFNTPRRPSQTTESYYLSSLVRVQEVAHIDGGYRPPVGLNVPNDGLSLAGFQVICMAGFE
jgi:hypothetical protein